MGGSALRHVAAALREDREVALTALRQDCTCIIHVAAALYEDPEIREYFRKTSHSAAQAATDAFYADARHARAAAEREADKEAKQSHAAKPGGAAAFRRSVNAIRASRRSTATLLDPVGCK